MSNTVDIIKTPTNRQLIALILFSFLATFALARLTVYLILGRLIPNLFLIVHGVHIHHFTYGVCILAVTNLYMLLKRPPEFEPSYKWLAIAYGVGLGLTFDEFGMWIRLEDNYWIRQSYDAIIIVGLILLNISYYRWLVNAVHEILYTVGLKKRSSN